MARKAARLERAGALTPRDRMWAAIRALARHSDGEISPFSPVEVQALANVRAAEPVHVDSVITYLQGLCKAQPQYVALHEHDRPVGRNRSELYQYILIRDAGVEAPRVTRDGKPVTDGAVNEAMWAAMKALREFDTVELAQAASSTRKTAQTYVGALARAGYLVCTSEALRGGVGRDGRLARYRFNRAKNTGPRAPLVCRDKSVMDANTGTIVAPARKGAP